MPELLRILTIVAIAVAVALWIWRSRSPRRAPVAGDLGRRVIVGVARPASAEPLCRVAAAVAGGAGGSVTPMAILTPTASSGDRRQAEATVHRAEAVITDEGVLAAGHVRVDARLTDGLLHGVVEHGATALIVGWPHRDESGRFTTAVEELAATAPLPLLVARLDNGQWHRIILQVPREPTSNGLRASLRCTTQIAERLAAATKLEIMCVPSGAPVPPAADQLVLTPVAPEAAALRRAATSAPTVGDQILVLPHGARATERRPLLPAAADLYGLPGAAATSAPARRSE